VRSRLRRKRKKLQPQPQAHSLRLPLLVTSMRSLNQTIKDRAGSIARIEYSDELSDEGSNSRSGAQAPDRMLACYRH
jgi:hypothetical protein